MPIDTEFVAEITKRLESAVAANRRARKAYAVALTTGRGIEAARIRHIRAMDLVDVYRETLNEATAKPPPAP